MTTWTPNLPRFPLLDGRSPFQPLPRFSAALGDDAEIWVKREDLLPIAFGGNKLRNLEFLIGAALAEGADALVTSGRRWSNHCRLTAAAGARAGLDVHLVLTGPPLDSPGPNQRLDELLGATVHVTTTAERADREALVAAVTDDLRTAGRRPYVIAVGGSGAVGGVGQVLAGLELADQARERGVSPSAVVLPSATGGTQAGLLVGLELAGLRARVVGVTVAATATELRPAVQILVRDLGSLTGCVVDAGSLEFDEGERGAGYGIATTEAHDATRLLARSEGIVVDPIYTAKALAGLIRGVRERSLSGQIVFWHAGGTPALFEPLDGPDVANPGRIARGA